MKYGDWLERHRRSLLFLMAVLALAGAVSAVKLPVALFPHVDFPRVVVSLDAGDRPAERMAVEVTQPIEEVLRSIPGVRAIRSTTSRGAADISVTFGWGDDMVAALLQADAAVGRALPSLPAETTYDVVRMDPTVFPALGYSLTSDTVSQVGLYELAQYQLRPLLSSVEGVAQVGVQGGQQQEYRVTVDAASLAGYGLTLAEVASALEATNTVVALGRLEDHDHLYLVMSQSKMTTLGEIENTVLSMGSNGAVLLEDVATVSDVSAPVWTRVTADGHEAVLLLVYQQPGGNTVSIADAVKQQLAGYRDQLPPGVRIAPWYDQSELILASAASVRDAILIGIGLAGLILLVFLRSLRLTLIAVIAVPSVLATTVLLLFVLGMSFNIMTLGGMAAAVGLVIDDTIVMVEHLVRRLGDGSGGVGERLRRAAEEFSRPLVGSSGSTIIIFAPLAFLSGVTGAFFRALSLTMASCLTISFFIAWLAVPLLAGMLLRKHPEEPSAQGLVGRAVGSLYAAVMRRVLRHPTLVLLAIVPLIAAGWLSYRSLGSGFMPSMDEGGFILDYRALPGMSLTETDRLIRQVEQILQDTPEVQTYSRRTGLQLGGALTEANEGDFFIRLVPPPRRPIDEVMDEVRLRAEQGVPGLDIEMALLMEDLIGDLTAVPQPIEVKIFSDDGELLSRLGADVADVIAAIPGVVDVQSGVVLAGDALEVEVDRVRAALEGLDPGAVASQLTDALSGVIATTIQNGPQMIGTRVWIARGDRATVQDVEDLRIAAPDGHLVPVRRIASVTRVTGQPQITREDLKRMVAVTGRISGRDMGSVMRDVRAALDQPDLLPTGVYTRLGGLYAEQQAAFSGLIAVFGAAVALVFFLLLFLYERFRIALAMMITTLLALGAVMLGLAVTGTELNISSMMGMTMVVGIVTEVGIFYASELAELAEEPDVQRRLLLAGQNRFRPIAMTTLAAILALMPLALGLGEGSAMQQPLAIAIVSGLVVQQPLVLVVLPALLRLFRAVGDGADGAEATV